MELTLAHQIFIVLMIVGLILIGAEIFVPGGFLGIIGGLALVGAIFAAFKAFGPTAGGYITIGIIVLVGIVIMLWAKYFPETSLGKKMTVSNDLSAAKGTEPGLDKLMGKDGKALSDLRPAGFARIDGRRVDVVTQGEMISKGKHVRVIEIEANRVIVGKV